VHTNGDQGKDEFFRGAMYMVSITDWPRDDFQTEVPVTSSGNARLAFCRTDPADSRHIPPPTQEDLLATTRTFSLMNSGNRTLHVPKRSWKIELDAAGGDDRVAGMAKLNVKAMYNDPAQMREALAWHLFRAAGVPAPRHTYAKLAINGRYLGLFSLVEQVDRAFLKDHFGKNNRGNLYKAYCGDIGCATLEHRVGQDGDDSGRQYADPRGADQTYRLKTNEDDPAANTFDDLAQVIRVVNGVGLGGGSERFGSPAFRESVQGVLNVNGFLRWAGVNLLVGGWDNYFATPANYYLYNSGRRGGEKDFVQDPYFTFIPWDYDNTFGIDYFGTRWQYTDIVDWPSNTTAYWGGTGKTSRIPLVQNLLRHHDLCRYYLDHLEHLLDTVFNLDAVAAAIAPDRPDGLWERVRHAAYLESDTPHGKPFTGRQFSNDEVYLSGSKQNELRHGNAKIEGIYHLRPHAVRQRPGAAGDPARDLSERRQRGDISGRPGGAAGSVLNPRGGCPPGPVGVDGLHSATPSSARRLELVREAKIRELLDGSAGRRFEASGVVAVEDRFYVIFDNLPHVAMLGAALSPDPAANRLLEQAAAPVGYEDIAYDRHEHRFYLLVEAARYRSHTFAARVRVFDETFDHLSSGWLDFPLERRNKGLEGLTCMRRGGQTYLLGLCEGNRCKGGAAGRRPGGGRIQLFTAGRRHWQHTATIRLPRTLWFEDYSSVAVTEDRVAVMSQTNSALWVGRFEPSSWRLADDGTTYLFPRDEKGRTVYGNVEGLSWVAPDQVVVVSDKAKRAQPKRCRAKECSIHLFAIPS
jgi:hypothetical protein